MTSIILFDPQEACENLLPLTLTRPVALLRCGIMTISEKWRRAIPGDHSLLTREYLSTKYPSADTPDGDNIFIAGNLLPSPSLSEAIVSLKAGEALYHNDTLIALRGNRDDLDDTSSLTHRRFQGDVTAINYLYDIFMLNGVALADDFTTLTAGRTSAPLPSNCTLIGSPENLFIENDATLNCATINVTHGPVYIGHGCEVMEGSHIRGGFAMLDGSVVNMGSKIYGATTLGPHCKVGGELNNVVMTGFSNKAHDGFLGNAVIGEWCNLGAGCTASNLKNDYTPIKLWNYPTHRFLPTGLQFCGLIMGDHSKAGINTMFNTATVVGVGCNIHGTGFPRNFVASFQDGSASGFSDVSFHRFIDTVRRVMARRDIELTDTDIEILQHVNEFAENFK